MDSNHGPLVLEETALPTEPQPLPYVTIYQKCWIKISRISLGRKWKRKLHFGIFFKSFESEKQTKEEISVTRRPNNSFNISTYTTMNAQ